MGLTNDDEYAGVNDDMDALDPDKKMELYKMLGRQNEFEVALRGLIDAFMPMAGSIHENGDPTTDKGNKIIAHFADGIRQFRNYINEVSKEKAKIEAASSPTTDPASP